MCGLCLIREKWMVPSVLTFLSSSLPHLLQFFSLCPVFNFFPLNGVLVSQNWSIQGDSDSTPTVIVGSMWELHLLRTNLWNLIKLQWGRDFLGIAAITFRNIMFHDSISLWCPENYILTFQKNIMNLNNYVTYQKYWLPLANIILGCSHFIFLASQHIYLQKSAVSLSFVNSVSDWILFSDFKKKQFLLTPPLLRKAWCSFHFIPYLNV